MTNLFPSGDAKISACGLYRYRLSRTWDENADPVVFVMLNPSTADASEDDPTIRRCVGFARAWGAGGVVVVNLFAWRATDPRGLFFTDDPVGLANDVEIADACMGRRVIAAWGATLPKLKERPARVLNILRRVAASVECLRRTKDGHPGHPLYVPASAVPVPFGG